MISGFLRADKRKLNKLENIHREGRLGLAAAWGGRSVWLIPLLARRLCAKEGSLGRA